MNNINYTFLSVFFIYFMKNISFIYTYNKVTKLLLSFF